MTQPESESIHDPLMGPAVESFLAWARVHRPRGLEEGLPTARGEPGRADELVAEVKRGELRLGPYLIVRELGRGGQGVVFLARDEARRRDVALKLLPGSADEASPHHRRRLAREAELAKKLRHPAICRVYDARLDGRFPFLAMEHISGESLAQRIACALEEGHEGPVELVRGRPPRRREEMLADVLTFVARIADGLQAAHESDVVHRDVKPGNIMIRPDGGPVILDFGLARDLEAASSLTASADFFGTLAYMPPEQLGRTRRRADRRADVYALGVTLFECLTLRRPFLASSREELIEAIRWRPAPRLRELLPVAPAQLEVVLDKALAKRPERRYRTARELADDLRRLTERRPVRARSPGAAVRAWDAAARRPVRTLVVAAFALFLAATTVLWRASERKSRELRSLADGLMIERLVSEREGLYPARPSLIPAMDAWLAEAEGIVRRARSREPAAVKRSSRVAALEQMIAGVRSDRGRASRVERVTIDRYRDRWEHVRDEVADDEAYDRLDLDPQIGLIPLGRNDSTGLVEFLHWDTHAGALPSPKGHHVPVAMGPETGVILVLIPGGTFAMGAQSADDLAPNYDPDATEAEGPVHEVQIDPFFIARYELTQGQLERIGANPSFYGASSASRLTEHRVHPAESLSHDTCMRVLERVELTLPTEAQWEYAARARAPAGASSGDARAALEGRANVADEAARAAGATWAAIETGFHDGFAIHAPVGSYSPNRFGLYDVQGNVWEWCADRFAPYPGADESLRPPARRWPETFVIRGGSYSDGLSATRFAHRSHAPHDARASNIGVRPARRFPRGRGG